jgi:hypothetical protein
MTALLPSPLLAFSDANGYPLAGASLSTYVVGTSTPVTTWSDSAGTVANTNPIMTDLSGRCSVYASGAVRLVLHDSSGNLVFDAPSNTLVSSAMSAVCLAPDIATAAGLLGIPAAVSAETGLRTAAVAAEQTARIAADTAEAAARAAADVTLGTAIAAEVTRATAAEATLTAAGKMMAGYAVCDGDGHHHVTFATAFTTITGFCASVAGSGLTTYNVTVSPTITGADVWVASYSSGGPVMAASAGFFWIAIGT